MANPFVPDEGWDTVPRPMGPWEARFAQYLQPAPDTTYGSVLPIARDNTTGALRLALPSSVRDLAQGALQLIDGPATGTVTPQATMALASLPVASGLAAGADATGNALASGPIVAYHGSPYDFDAFDASKIGTGEGAQAYGHGLYFAGNEAVAQNYRDALKWRGTDWNDPQYVAGFWSKHFGSTDKALQHLQSALPQQSTPEAKSAVSGAIDILQNGSAGAGSANPGHMYQVQLNADPDAMLDWDKPLSEQPQAVQDIAVKVKQGGGIQARKLNDASTGGDLYHAMRSPFPAQSLGYQNWSTSGPSETLNQAGIPGIKYLDAGSRAAGDGTRNYVMFDPATIAILRKYGLAAMLAGGGADAVANAPQQGS